MKSIKTIKLGECVECISHKTDNDGYPRLCRSGKQYRAHRYFYEQKNGKIEIGKVLRHTCDNRRCVNLEHLVVGSILDNVRDRVERNRSASGKNNGNSRLTEKEVLEIRSSRESQSILARKYKVTSGYIFHIKNNLVWKHSAG